MTSKFIFRVSEDSVTYENVSNLDSKRISQAEKHCLSLLKKINRSGYKEFGGTKNTITFYVDSGFSEDELDLLWKVRLG